MSSAFLNLLHKKSVSLSPRKKKENNIVAGSNINILSTTKSFVNTHHNPTNKTVHHYFNISLININNFLRYIYKIIDKKMNISILHLH
jgi:hypothetical protein